MVCEHHLTLKVASFGSSTPNTTIRLDNNYDFIHFDGHFCLHLSAINRLSALSFHPTGVESMDGGGLKTLCPISPEFDLLQKYVQLNFLNT